MAVLRSRQSKRVHPIPSRDDTDQRGCGRKLSEQTFGSEAGVIPFGNGVDFRVTESSRIHSGNGHTTTIHFNKM